MRFKVVSVGWNCQSWIEQTLRSVESQSVDNWDVYITYDASPDDGASVIRRWCDSRDDRWCYQINDDRRFAVRNQYEAIVALAPAPDDVVVFLDLDGDQLAHPDVFADLATHYRGDVLVTYGSYRPVPEGNPVGHIAPYPNRVVQDRSYRQFTLTRGCRFNHLRTMKGKVANAIPESALKWERGRMAGQWYEIGTDYVFMMAALELADGRYKCLRETLLLYNHANPYADNISHDQAGTSCVLDCLQREPLPPLGA